MHIERLKLLPKELRNLGYFSVVRLLSPLLRVLSKPDVAFLYVEHPVLLPFMIRMKTHLGLNLHFIQPGGDISRYRKVIIPNGMWPSLIEAAAAIPEAKKVYCEVGFFPQNSNVYFDPKGVHGHSTLLDVELKPLDEKQIQQLQNFREFYAKHNFVRLKWDTVDLDEGEPEDAACRYDFDFIFIPLQLESDTAFDLCPFENNQQIVTYIESELPDEKLVFKIHPLDPNAAYRTSGENIMLPAGNRDLKLLLSRCKAVVGSNSTVILEALLLRKKCAACGIGIPTNHQVTLECHDDLHRLRTLNSWEPDWTRVDQFVSLLLERQVPVDFYKRPDEKDKLLRWLGVFDIIPTVKQT